MSIGKAELKKIFSAIEKGAGSVGSINYTDIIQYVSLGDSFLISTLDDDDDIDIDKGIWGSSPIVDLQMSTSEIEEANLQKDGYDRVLARGDVPANLNEGVMLSSPILLWYRRKGQGGSGVRLKPIVDIVLSEKLIDSALVIAGYTCLNKSVSKGTLAGKDQYLWIRRAFTPEETEKDAIVDIAVTQGKMADLDDQVHKPPGRGFIQIAGDLNRRQFFAKNIFMWFRPVTPRSSAKVWRGVSDEERNYELECSARRAIRQFVSPADLNFSPRGGPTDFAVLFNRHAVETARFDKSKVGTLSVSGFGNLLREVGLNVNTADTKHLMHRIDVTNIGRISREEFLAFVQLNDDELDEVAVKIKEFFGVTKSGSANKKVSKAIKERFKRLDQDGDGVLDIEEFRQMVQMVGIFLTETELTRLRRVFDPNGDGMVGTQEFEDVVLGFEDPTKRQSIRVGDAAQALRNYILQCQRGVKKKDPKEVDSESAWLDLERKHKRGVGGSPFPGYLDLEDIAQAVERLGYRLSQQETRALIMRVAPDGVGRVSQADFHEFATEPKPRPVGELISVMCKSKDALLSEAVSTKNKDKKLQKYLNRVVTAIGPDEMGLVTVEGLSNGLSTFFNYRERSGQPSDGELVSLAQYLGSVDLRFFMVDPRLFILGLRTEATGESIEKLLRLSEDEQGEIYSELLKSRKSKKATARLDDDEDDPSSDADEKDEYEYENVEVEEEVYVDEDLYDVCELLSGFFADEASASGDGDKPVNKKPGKSSLDFERCLDIINEKREKGASVDIEDDLRPWLRTFEEVTSLSSSDFATLLERFDPKNTKKLTANQLEDFSSDKASWITNRKVKIVKRVERVKSKKKKTKKTPAKASSSKSAKKSSSTKKGGKSKKGYLSSSDEEDEDDEERDDSDNSEKDDDDDDDDDDDNDSDAKDDRSDNNSDEDSDIDVVFKKKKNSGKDNKSKRGKNADSDDDSVGDNDFISSPLRADKNKKKITGNASADTLVRDVAKSLSAKHRNLSNGLEHMLKSEFRKLDVFASGLLRPDEVSRSLRSLGFKRTVDANTSGVKFFLDRGGNMDYSGFASAVGQASWELEHDDRDRPRGTGNKKLDTKLKNLAKDLRDASKSVEKMFGPFVSDEGLLSRNDFKQGLKKAKNLTDVVLSDVDVRKLFAALNAEADGGGSEASIAMDDWRSFVSSGGSSLFSSSNQDDDFDDAATDHSFYSTDGGDAMDKDFDQALDRCSEEFSEMDLSKKNKGKVRTWFENIDKSDKGYVSTKDFETFLKKSKVHSKLSSRERKNLVQALDSRGKGKVDYNKFVEKCIENKRFAGSRVTSDQILHRMQDAVGNCVRTGSTYAMIFQRYDPNGTGLVTREGFIGSFRVAGCFLNDADLSTLSSDHKLGKSRGDGLIDYNEFYQVLLQTTPRVSTFQAGGTMNVGGYGQQTPFVNTGAFLGSTFNPPTPWGGVAGGGMSPYNSFKGGLGQSWPVNHGGMGSAPWNTPFNGGFNSVTTLGGSAALGGGGTSGDHLLQDVALKLRNAMRQRVSQWGPSVSLHRQFEASDADRRGYINLKSFVSVLEQLGILLTPIEVGVISRRFDRHGNDTVDYLDFCRFVSIDAREMEIVASKLASKFGELRRRGVSATATFDVYDIGRTGFVARRDFRECSRQLQLPVTENQLEALMGRFAHQGDGELVSWQEFITFVNASGVNLPMDDLEPVMGDGYDGMDYNDRGSSRGSPKNNRRGASDDDFRDMYKGLRAHNREDDFVIRNSGGGLRAASSGEDGYYSSGLLVDHTDRGRSDSTHTQDMRRSAERGREAVNYLDKNGVSTPKWIRSVLKVGRGTGGFDNAAAAADEGSDDEFAFGKKPISRSDGYGSSSSAAKKSTSKKGNNRSTTRHKNRYDNSDSDSSF